MRLEDVTAELRPRSDWEAVDLGLALARRDFWRLVGAWWLGMLPMLALTVATLHDHPVLVVLACWWWVPVASRLTLFVISRHLFGELPDGKAIVREWPRAMFRRFGFRMLWARLSPWRPLTMAVEDLEGLRGKTYAQRVRLLLRRGDATVVALALWRGALTLWIAIALMGTAALFLPQGQAEQWHVLSQTLNEDTWLNLPPSFGWILAISVLVSMSLVDVFSTGAGFGIYVNHRTWIEGWDVELAFRRLGSRLSGTVIAFMAGLLCWTGTIEPSTAATPGETITEVKAHEDFKIHHVEEKRRNPPKWNWAPGDWMLVLGKIVFYCAICAFVAFIGWLIWRNRHLFKTDGFSKRVPRIPPQAKVVMGMNVAPESLPADIPAAALELWRVGRRQEAMSLLYRGSISKLITSSGVEIAESDTESDCLRRVTNEATSYAGYFSSLTEAWVLLAYGRSIPPDRTMEELCDGWPFREGRTA